MASCTMSPAFAQGAVCTKATPEAHGELMKKFAEEGIGEFPVAMGTVSPGGQVIAELTLNETTGSWTFLFIHPNGSVCMIANGRGMAIVKPSAKGDPA